MTQLIVALDDPSAASIGALVNALGDEVKWYKVGYEAFYALGAPIVEDLQARGKSVFLDLKLHDVPNTVGAGLRALAPLQPDFVTVHAAGGPEMLAAAVAARDAMRAAGAQTRLLAVTVLTSIDEATLRAVGADLSPHRMVATLAALAAECGIDGVVCAVDEVPIVRARASSLLTVCPGIRPAGESPGDQKRVATPSAAALAGADFVVVGRPIVQAPDPAAAAAAIVAELRATSAFGVPDR